MLKQQLKIVHELQLSLQPTLGATLVAKRDCLSNLDDAVVGLRHGLPWQKPLLPLLHGVKQDEQLQKVMAQEDLKVMVQMVLVLEILVLP